ncbi:MAG: TolC family outer membrane protein [Pseudomonadota bacterium]
MRRFILLIFCLFGLINFATARTINLLDAYYMGLGFDATYKTAYAQFLADREAAPQALALLLPQLTATANYGKEHERLEDGASGTFDAYLYALDASQTLFDYSAFSQLVSARASVKQAAFTVAFAEQDLMLRVATAYFDVLQAEEILQYAKEQRDNLKKQLDIVKEQFKVKHATITDVNQAEGFYDIARTDYLSALNTLFDVEQNLNEVIGDNHGGLAKLKRRFPLVNPRPMNLSIWERKVVRDNLSINAARYGIDAARATIEVERGGNFPVVNAVANITRQRLPNASVQFAIAQRFTNRSAGVAINFPFFQGGFVLSRTRQAEALYQRSLAEFDNAYNVNIRDARQAFNGIVIGRRLVIAGYEAIRSNTDALRNTQEGYKVGTESVIDVIVQQTNLFQAQTQLADEKYTYLLDIIRLELAAGSLSLKTLAQINAYLEHPKGYQYHIPLHHYQKRYRFYLSKHVHTDYRKLQLEMPKTYEPKKTSDKKRQIKTQQAKSSYHAKPYRLKQYKKQHHEATQHGHIQTKQKSAAHKLQLHLEMHEES